MCQRRIVFRHLGALLLICLMIPSHSFGGASSNLPLDHWAYEAINKMVGYGLVHTEIKGIRPYSRNEAARLTKEALDNLSLETRELPEFGQHMLDRLVDEFKDELAGLGCGDGRRAETFWKPIDRARAQYVFRDGRARVFQTDKGGISATEGNPALGNRNGVLYGNNHNLALQVSTRAKLYDVFSAYVEPIFQIRETNDNLQNLESTNVDLLKGYMKLSNWNVEIEFGRDSVWWGQGRRGSLILTNNSEPLDMVKLGTPEPVLLPWIFRYLGLIKINTMFAQLGDDRYVPDAILGGTKLSLKPMPYLEFGIQGQFLAMGEGQPALGFADLMQLMLLGNPGGGTSEDKAEGQFAVDARGILPFLRNTELYMEFGWADRFKDTAFLGGMYVPCLTADGKTDFRFEFAYNVLERDRQPWYAGRRYRSGQTHQHLILGHPMGPDAMDAYGRLGRYITNDLRLGLSGGYMERGFHTQNEITEKSYRGGLDVVWDVTEDISLNVDYGYERINDFDYIDGKEQTNHCLSMAVTYSF